MQLITFHITYTKFNTQNFEIPLEQDSVYQIPIFYTGGWLETTHSPISKNITVPFIFPTHFLKSILICYLWSHSNCHCISQYIHTLQHAYPGLLAELEVVGRIEPCLCRTS